MHFDRFDVFVAYYHFSCLVLCRSKLSHCEKANVMQVQDNIARRVRKLPYKLSFSMSNLADISDNAKQIYMHLVNYYLKSE